VSSAWPWQVRINLLGGFQMSVEGKTVNEKVSAQKKVLILLKVLTSSGGSKIAANRLADIIWPDADGDDARNALKTTVQRLRKLLGDSKCVEFSDGCVGLSTESCWIDAAAFVDMAGMQRSSGDRVKVLKQALEVYAGVLLPGEEEAWALEPRARLQRIAHELVMELGTHYESRHRWRRAIRVYKRVFELEPMDEQICRHLMTCYEQSGHNEDALEVFDRCRAELEKNRIRSPAARTTQLADAIARH
jgi:LuxR family maltose regulon positive regulatory protein